MSKKQFTFTISLLVSVTYAGLVAAWLGLPIVTTMLAATIACSVSWALLDLMGLVDL